MTGPSGDPFLERALDAARDTRYLAVEPGARHGAGNVFSRIFGSPRSVVVADENTFEAAGRDVADSLLRSGLECASPYIFPGDVYAEYSYAEKLAATLTARSAVPVAVGSGTINDLVKLAAYRSGRPYMVVATAASMDGYTAFGASITCRGAKQTLDCPAPTAVLADLDVIAAAPPGMNASGYADLLAKRAAGADWILADAAGEEPIDPAVWSAVQDLLRSWLTDPAGVPRNDPACLRGLIQGLLMVGFAMQAHRSSRPASGAEHQFSHLWDMQNHRHGSAAPSHGFKVGIGTLASLALYEDLLRNGEPEFDIAGAGKKWPSREEFDRRVEETFGPGDIAEKAKEETRAKYLPREDLEKQLYRLRGDWPRLRGRLKEHLFGFTEVRDMLREAGCPAEPEEIGISRERLRRSYRQAYFIRRRYTVLDFAERWALSGTCGDRVFGRRGPWPPAA